MLAYLAMATRWQMMQRAQTKRRERVGAPDIDSSATTCTVWQL